MLKDLQIEKLIVKDIDYQVTNAETDLKNGFKEAAHHRLQLAHTFCQNLQNRLADAIEETS